MTKSSHSQIRLPRRFTRRSIQLMCLLSAALSILSVTVQVVAAPEPQRTPPTTESAASAKANYSFSAWRAGQIEKAVKDLEAAKRKLSATLAEPAASAADPQYRGRLRDVRSQLEQAEMQLASAKELSFSDYLDLHVASLRSREADEKLALNMGPSEVAELISAYRRLLALRSAGASDSSDPR